MTQLKALRGIQRNWRYVSLGFLLYLISVFAYSTWQFLIAERELLAETDERLLIAAQVTDHYLGPHYHDRTTAIDSLSADEYTQIVNELTALAQALNVTYLYSLVRQGDMLYFASDSLQPEDLERGLATAYFDAYEDIVPAELDAFDAPGPTFLSDISVRWGDFRTVYLPGVSSQGVPYVIGANLRRESLDVLQSAKIKEALELFAASLLLVVPMLLMVIVPLRRLAFRNPLTNLPNRMRLQADLERATPSQQYLAVINILEFHRINDAFGTQEGDRILREVCLRLRTKLGKRAPLYHIYADEFAFLFSHDDPCTYLETLHEHMEGESMRADHHMVHLRFRIGYADAQKPRALRHANEALQLGKRQHARVTSQVSAETRHATLQNLDDVHELHEALREQRVEAWYMPIRDLRSSTIHGYEALARIRLRNGDYLQPNAFIALAKEYNLLSAITEEILRQALKVFATRKDRVAINLTHADIVSSIQLERIYQYLKAFPEPQRITLELIETDLFMHQRHAIPGLERLRTTGVEVGIDDFGTGYSNFSLLAALNINELKIDGSLIEPLIPHNGVTIEQSQIKYKIVQTMTQLAHELGMLVCAEFVADDALLTIVKDLGIDLAQGFAIGEAQPAPLPENT